MQLGLSFVLGLISASTVAYAAQDSGILIPLTRRSVNDTAEAKFAKRPVISQVVSNKYHRGLQNYKKNTGNSHPFESDSAKEKRATGSINLVDIQHESEWGGRLSYGSPAQSFYVDFDTGSADTLVNPGAYKPEASVTSKRTADRFSSAYGDGTTASGYIYVDNAKLANSNATDVAIGLSTTQFMSSSESPNVGISGLALPHVQAFPSQYLPLFTALRKAKTVDQGVFQFTLRPGTGSSLFIGGIDNSQYTGDIAWQSFDPSLGFYVAPATINGQQINTIVDSGTTLIMGPTSQVRQFLQSLPGVTVATVQGLLSGLYDCNSPPKVTINYAGKDFTLGKSQLQFGTSSGKCVLSVTGNDNLPMNAWIVGDVFFQMASVIFDQDKNRLGFAAQAGLKAVPSNSTSSSTDPSSTSSSKSGTTVAPLPVQTSKASSTSAPSTSAPQSSSAASSSSKSSSSSSSHPSPSSGSSAAAPVPTSVKTTSFVTLPSSVKPSQSATVSSKGPSSTVAPVMTATVSGTQVSVTATKSIDNHQCGEDSLFGIVFCFSGEFLGHSFSFGF